MVEKDSQCAEESTRPHRVQMIFSESLIQVMDNNLSYLLNAQNRTEVVRRSVEAVRSLEKLYHLNPELTLGETLSLIFPNIDLYSGEKDMSVDSGSSINPAN